MAPGNCLQSAPLNCMLFSSSTLTCLLPPPNLSLQLEWHSPNPDSELLLLKSPTACFPCLQNLVQAVAPPEPTSLTSSISQPTPSALGLVYSPKAPCLCPAVTHTSMPFPQGPAPYPMRTRTVPTSPSWRPASRFGVPRLLAVLPPALQPLRAGTLYPASPCPRARAGSPDGRHEGHSTEPLPRAPRPLRSPTLSHTPVGPSQSLVRRAAQGGRSHPTGGPREATGRRPRPHCALPGSPHCLCSMAAATTSKHRGGELAGTRNRTPRKGGGQYLAGELPLQHFQLLLGPETGAPLLEDAGAQLVHLPEELPLGQLQLLDSAAQKQAGAHPGCSKHGRGSHRQRGRPSVFVIWPM